jgi:hypothetical protein
MKMREMKAGIHYVVIKGTKDKAFKKGDKVELCGLTKDVLNKQAGGWMNSSDLEDSGYIDTVCVDVDKKWYRKRKEILLEELALLESIKDE